MKINEILIENILSKGIAAAKRGYRASQASRQQEEQTKKLAAGALQKWVAIDKNIKLSGQQPAPAQAVQWFTTFTGGVAPTTTPTNTSLNTMSQWLNTEISNVMAQRELGTSSQPASTPAQVPQSKAPTSTRVPQGQAQSPTDVVNRLMKLHPDWVPEITKQLLNKQTVTAR